VLQCVAVTSVEKERQPTAGAVCCNVPLCITVCCIAVCCSMLQHSLSHENFNRRQVQCVAVVVALMMLYKAHYAFDFLCFDPEACTLMSVLQCVAVCCSVLQCVVVCCSVLQCAAVCCSVLQCVAVCCSVL